MTLKLACPFCYRQIARRNDLWFLCRGRPAGGRRPCRPRVDEARRNLTGFAQPMLPAFRPPSDSSLLQRGRANCPQCGGETTARACPDCHTRLPQEFGAASSPLVAVVGARHTGKTVFLTVLSEELQSRKIREEFDVTVQPIGAGQEGFASQSQQVRQNIDRVYRDLQLFPATAQAVDGRKEPMVLEWRVERAGRLIRRRRTHYLSFYDTAGEDLADDAETHGLHYLRAANFLVLLLDPFQLPETREMLRLPPAAVPQNEPTRDVLARITETLKDSEHWNGQQITAPVAVAFAKMDAFYQHLGDTHPLRRVRRRPGGYDEETGRTVHTQMAALLDRWGGSEINAHLRSYYRDFRYFFVSALGAEPDYDNATVNPRGVRPDRVEEPLLWLMCKGGLVPRTSA
jgi:Double-GTPase 2